MIAGDVGGLADRSWPGFYDHKTDFATMTNAELCERLRPYAGVGSLVDEVVKRFEAQIDETLSAWACRRRPDIVGFDGADFTWKDECGVMWHRPTATAYAQARRKRVAE